MEDTNRNDSHSDMAVHNSQKGSFLTKQLYYLERIHKTTLQLSQPNKFSSYSNSITPQPITLTNYPIFQTQINHKSYLIKKSFMAPINDSKNKILN
jgi:hypothetical protein